MPMNCKIYCTRMETLVVTFIVVLKAFNQLVLADALPANIDGRTRIQIIEPLVHEVELPFGVGWNVSCKSNVPIVWKPYDPWFDWTPPNVTSTAISTGDAEMQYGAVLSISNASAASVGRYYCVTSEKKDENLEEMETEDLASSVYVFVKDYKQPIVPTPGQVYYIQSEEVFIPCKPSYPNIEVMLCNKVGECLTPPIDATKGFRISQNLLKFSEDETLVCKCVNASYSIQLLTCDIAVTTPHLALKLELLAGEIELSYGATWDVTCKSNKPIVWKPYDAWFEWNPSNVESTAFTTDDKNMQYGSILTISNASAESVGRYYCVISEKSEEDLDEMIIQEFATSVYVFVADYKQPLVPVNYETMKRNRGKKIVIPCKPSFPGMKVELCYESGRFCMTKCDPRKGFSIYDETFHTSLEAFVCRCNHTVNHIPKLESVGLPKPTIASDTNGIVPLGKPIKLVCSVTLAPNKTIEMTWKTLPNYQPADKNERIYVGQMIVTPHPELYNRDLATRELIIENATLEDKRTYRCEVSDGQYNINYHSYRVNVRETSDDYVILSGMNHRAVINRKRNTNGEFKPIDIFVKYRSYPSNITYSWAKGDLMLLDGNLGKYRMEQNEDYVRLTINGPTINDTGVYKLEVTAGAGISHFSVKVIVHDKPSVRMESKRATLGEEVEFICNVAGYALPEIRFWYQPCLEIPWHNCSNDDNTRRELNTTVRSSESSTSSIAITSISAETPGIVYCTATNSEGTGTDQAYLLVRSMTKEIQLERVPTDSLITVGDNVTFICSVIDVGCTHVPTSLRFLNNGKELPQSVGVNQTFFYDSIFLKSQLTITNVSLEMTGNMSCRIKSKDAYTTSKAIQLEVVAPIAPRLLSGNEHESIEKKVSESLVLWCNVTGTPHPEVTWFKDGAPFHLYVHDNRRHRNEFIISFDYLEKDDFGLYECRAVNKAGEICHYVQVQHQNDTLHWVVLAILIGLPVILPFVCIMMFRYKKNNHEKTVKDQFQISPHGKPLLHTIE